METEDTINDRFKELVAFQFGFSKKDVKDDALFEALGADSLDLVELIIAAEDEFAIDIDDQDAENLGTINDAVKYLNERLGILP